MHTHMYIYNTCIYEYILNNSVSEMFIFYPLKESEDKN